MSEPTPNSTATVHDSVTKASSKHFVHCADGTSYNKNWKANAPPIVSTDSDFDLPSHNISGRGPRPLEKRPDVFAKGYLSVDHGETVVARYRDMCSIFPVLASQRYADIQTLRESQPVKLLAMLNVGSHCESNLHQLIDNELREELGKRILVEGEKSLDVLQALLVYLAYYHLHFNPYSQQLYVYQGLATSLAVELGIYRSSRRPQPGIVSQSPFSPDHAPEPSKEDIMEDKRTAVCCYYICSFMSLATRRPNHFRFNDFIEQCCLELAESNALPTDKYLIHIVRLQRLAEEASETFGYTEKATLPLGIEMVRHTIKGFESRLVSLHRAFPDEASDMSKCNSKRKKRCLPAQSQSKWPITIPGSIFTR